MKRLSDPAAFFAGLAPAATVVLHSGFAEPPLLAHHLAAQAAELNGVRVLTLMPMGEPEYATAAATAHLDVATFLPGRGLRAAVDEGRARALRQPLSRIPGLFERGELRADAILLQVAPPDAQGLVSLGISVDYLRAVLAQSPVVVAEINPQMPRTLGDAALPVDRIDFFVDANGPLLEAAPVQADDVDRRIAQHVAALIEDGAVLQVGIGSLPDQVLAQLGHLKHLGLHSGIVSDGIRPLIEAGVIDNSTKRRFEGVSVTAMAGGTRDFYDFVHQNPAIEFHPCSVTHDPGVLRAIDCLCAINSALQVDLGGNANAEQANGRLISLPGGLPDFAAAATKSRGGKSIIALRSSFARGAHSNVVARLGEGAPVTVVADDIDFVVTEYGVASIRCLAPAQRAAALVAIAHPAHRERLQREFALLANS